MNKITQETIEAARACYHAQGADPHTRHRLYMVLQGKLNEQELAIARAKTAVDAFLLELKQMQFNGTRTSAPELPAPELPAPIVKADKPKVDGIKFEFWEYFAGAAVMTITFFRCVSAFTG